MSEHLEQRLIAYLHDELSAAERVDVETHLSDCALCSAELASLRSTQEF